MHRILLNLLFPILLFAEIIETPHIAKVVPYVDENTWLVLDIDETTFEAAQALGSSEWSKNYARKHGTIEATKMWIKIQPMCPVRPMEKDFIPNIVALQNKKIVVMAITLRQPELADATMKQAASLGLDFAKTAPSTKTVTFTLRAPMIYTQGVIYCNDIHAKGDIFLKFLNLIGKKPKKVVFVDDKIENVISMNRSLMSQGIDIISVHYTAKEFLPSVYSPELAAFQEIFLHKIMSNEAARLLMQHHLE